MAPADALLDLGSREAWLALAARALHGIRRRWISIAVITVVFVVVGVVTAALTPRTYSTATRVLVRKTYIMPALASPKRAVPSGADNLTQSAAELVRDRQSLLALIDQQDLLARWERERPVLLRTKDRVMARLFGEPSEADRAEALVDVLSKRISITVEDEVIRFWAQWTDPQTVVDVVDGAVDAFLEARRKVDVQAIIDTQTILEQSAASARADVEQHLAAVNLAQQLQPVRRTAATSIVTRVPVASDPLRGQRLAVVAALNTVSALQTAHAAQVRDMEVRLADIRTRETERHPDVVALQRQLAQVKGTPDAVRQAQADAQRVTADYVAQGGRMDDLHAADAPVAVATPQAVSFGPVAKDEPSDATLYARSLLESSIETYQDLLGRLQNTRIELETARASFGYRYTVVSPARVPRKADGPNVVLMVMGALLAGLGAGVARALFAEWRA
jgi:hypothetical protein